MTWPSVRNSLETSPCACVRSPSPFSPCCRVRRRDAGVAGAGAGHEPAAAGAGRGAAAAAGHPQFDHRRAGRDRAHRHPRCDGAGGAARSFRQARQPALPAAVQCRDRLDRRRAVRSRSPAGRTRWRFRPRSTERCAPPASSPPKAAGRVGKLLGGLLGQRRRARRAERWRAKPSISAPTSAATSR